MFGTVGSFEIGRLVTSREQRTPALAHMRPTETARPNGKVIYHPAFLRLATEEGIAAN